jgi:uncharacterized protein YbjT (DUF2867 family)
VSLACFRCIRNGNKAVIIKLNPPFPTSLPSAELSRSVLITGGTGYLGRALIPVLLARGHRVRALVRAGSERKLSAGVEAVTGDPLAAACVERSLAGADTLVHLVGVPKPSPAKARQFREIDLVSIQTTVMAAARALPRPHLVYLSVAQPAPVMKAYVTVRREGEALIAAAGLDATCLRPWYVLGPGHRWPCALLPIYAVLRLIPATRAGADRLGFVTLKQMVSALVHAVEHPAQGMRIVAVPEVRAANLVTQAKISDKPQSGGN